MEGQTVYSAFNLLDEVFTFEDELDTHGFLAKIITRYSDVMIARHCSWYPEIFQNKEN